VNVKNWELKDFQQFFGNVNVIFKDKLAHQIFKSAEYIQVLEKLAEVLGNIDANYSALQVDIIKQDRILQKAIADMYSLAGDIDILIAQKDFKGLTNEGKKLLLSTKRLYEQLMKIVLVTVIVTTLNQSDMDIEEFLIGNNYTKVISNLN
jgi:hypothetical protein